MLICCFTDAKVGIFPVLDKKKRKKYVKIDDFYPLAQFFLLFLFPFRPFFVPLHRFFRKHKR